MPLFCHGIGYRIQWSPSRPPMDPRLQIQFVLISLLCALCSALAGLFRNLAKGPLFVIPCSDMCASFHQNLDRRRGIDKGLIVFCRRTPSGYPASYVAANALYHISRRDGSWYTLDRQSFPFAAQILQQNKLLVSLRQRLVLCFSLC